jgi:hypothetical protein
MRKTKFSRAQIIRLNRLLYMKYKPSEIAKVLDVNVNTVYQSYLVNGCPHEKDSKGSIWIIGTEFRGWAESEIAERKKKINSPMQENQGLCLRCNKRVIMVDPRVVYSGGNREILQSICPICGTKVNRARGIN